MLKTAQILQERYRLTQKLGQNAGRQTWLALTPKLAPGSETGFLAPVPI